MLMQTQHWEAAVSSEELNISEVFYDDIVARSINGLQAYRFDYRFVSMLSTRIADKKGERENK